MEQEAKGRENEAEGREQDAEGREQEVEGRMQGDFKIGAFLKQGAGVSSNIWEGVVNLLWGRVQLY